MLRCAESAERAARKERDTRAERAACNKRNHPQRA